MKKIIILLFLSVQVTAHAQPIRFDVRYSEQYAVMEFVKKLSSRAPDNVFKKIFVGSDFDNTHHRGLLAQLDSLIIDYTYEFKEFPSGQKIEGTTETFLKMNLINTATLHDFKIRSLALIPYHNLNNLTKILTAFTPVYQTLIYKPNKDRFEKQLADFSALIKERDMDGYFNIIYRFYNSSWDSSLPFHFVFYPLPNSTGFTATAVSNLAISAIPSSLTDYNGLLAVMLHEIAHILFDEEPLKLKWQIHEWFNNHPSKNSQRAYALFNEASVTSVANGYLQTLMRGREDTVTNWYNSKYISQMAKKMYPMVKEYILANKGIDSVFFSRYIKLFDDNFSDWLNQLDYLFTGRYALSTNPEDFRTINKMFPPRNITEYHNEITERSIEAMLQTKITKIIIVSDENDKRLRLISHSFKELKDWKFEPGEDFVKVFRLNDKSALIILNNVKIGTKEKLESLNGRVKYEYE